TSVQCWSDRVGGVAASSGFSPVRGQSAAASLPRSEPATAGVWRSSDALEGTVLRRGLLGEPGAQDGSLCLGAFLSVASSEPDGGLLPGTRRVLQRGLQSQGGGRVAWASVRD